MALKDELVQALEQPFMRWGLVGVCVLILLRLKLVLFAAALPVVAYWHYSQQQEAGAEDDQDLAENEGVGEEDDENDDGLLGAEADDLDFGARGPNSSARADSDQLGAPRRSPGASRKPVDGDDDLGMDLDDDFGLGAGKGAKMPSDDLGMDLGLGGGAGGGLDDFDFGLGSKFGGGGGGSGGGGARRGGGGDFDFDFGMGGGDGDMDLLGGFGFGGGKSKGSKGGKGGKGKEKGKDGPREADPRQVFVSGIGDAPEDEVRVFFEEVGDVDRLKVLMTPEGTSKGVCFVTFRTEGQAQQALSLSGQPLEAGGRPIRVSLAHGGNKGEKGDKGDKGFGKGPPRGGFGGDRDRDLDGLPDFGASERFGSAFGDRPGFGGSKGGKKGKGEKSGKRGGRAELDDLLEDALEEADGPVRLNDFDFAARRFLTELLSRDRSDGTSRFQEAMDMVIKYTSSKDRSSVRKWPAYIFTLLQKFDPTLWEELRERDAERRREKGGGGGFSRNRDFGDGDMERPPRRFDPDD